MCNRVNDKMNRQSGQKDGRKMRREGLEKKGKEIRSDKSLGDTKTCVVKKLFRVRSHVDETAEQKEKSWLK